ncbi:aldo/keto reductase [Flavobacterium arcticum]|uniref:Aldo/keto reductase n=1 Tax=Flavobacterium arcticum TaxID=1784713 RepID=A0A345HCX2_9FLAO|nr:aldo/keto reductase [Flavobacterium arcticum]AXG74432.1 aldo/keto reductase [Flavobacterium arcticum]KAF2512447.1 aldo/keto reductase [Flavobacterium arcticum]
MKYNFLGQTGLLVSELCFGTMTFGSNEGYWQAIAGTEQAEVNQLIKTVVDSGINFIDTANVYSFGESERLLGQSIKEVGLNRNELVIATKVRGTMNQSPNSQGLSRYHIFNSVDESLQRLQMNHIDILYLHGVDYKTPVEEIMRTLNDIVLTGKVRYVAVCNWPAWMVMKAQGIADKNGWNKFIGLQYFYSLAGRDIEREIVPLAEDQDLAIMPWSPLAGGFLSGKYTRNDEASKGRRANFDFPPINKEKTFDIIDVITQIGKTHNATPAQIALAWVRQQQAITSTIIGAKNSNQLIDNIKSTEITLNTEQLEQIDLVSALQKEYPQWMVERQSGGREKSN